jgi:AIPR protein
MAPSSFARTIPSVFPHIYRFRISQEHIRSLADPHDPDITIHHVYIPVREFKREMLPDDINPRSHDEPTGRVPQAIEASLLDYPKEFHLLNRGELIIAQSCKYDNGTKTLEITIGSKEDGGLADGATTDRVLAQAEDALANKRHSNRTPEELEESLSTAHVHLEIISGNLRDKLVRLAGARNTSNQVKEFALENLGGGFDWLKKLVEASALKGRIRYRENDPEPVDIRTVLALLTLFHPKWKELGKEPIIGYTSKGTVLNNYRDKEWLSGYKSLSPIVVNILELYDHIHCEFEPQYRKYNRETNDSGSKLGRRREVLYKGGAEFELPLTGSKTKYSIPDGWLYPILASFRMLVQHVQGDAKWVTEPKTFFDESGYELVGSVVEQSKDLGFNPQAVGKSRPLWTNLRDKMELQALKIASQP